MQPSFLYCERKTSTPLLTYLVDLSSIAVPQKFELARKVEVTTIQKLAMRLVANLHLIFEVVIESVEKIQFSMSLQTSFARQ